MSDTATRLQAYLDAEAAVLKGKRFRMGERDLELSDLSEIRDGIRDLEARLQGEQQTARGERRGVLLANFGGSR